MTEIDISPYMAVFGSAGALVIGWRVIWPLLKQFVETQTTQGRTESGLLTQTSIERDKAVARAEAAEKRADGYFKDMADMKGQIALLTYQLQVSTEQIERMTTQLHSAQIQIEALTNKLNILTGGKNA